MQEIEAVFTIVAKILIYSGGVAFLICFLFGAKLIWEMFKLAREEAHKSGYFDDDTKDIK